jgi:hypothetical protein
MASWGEAASERARQDLDALLSSSLSYARQQLGEDGEFAPFAVVVRADGVRELVTAAPDSGAQPTSADLLAQCRDGLRGRQDQLRAVAVVADVRARELDSDAIRADLEHAEGIAVTVLQPYSQRRFGRPIRYGELHAEPAPRTLWRRA